MKTKILKLANLILAIFLFAFTVTYTFAWFSDKIILATGPQGGSVGAYFAYGDGLSEDTAFGITDARHLYNLSALQNNGRFDESTYYFEIAENTKIDMSTFNYCIAPIGNDTHPFTGVFNGNGGTISNLKVSTDKNKLRGGDPAKDAAYVFSYSVGLFGVTGGQSNVRNFILDTPQVEAVDSNTSYNSEATNKYAGLAIGYVANAASSIGVMGGTLSVQMSGYTTYNSILGDIGDLSSDVAGETVIGESDTGYLVPEFLYEVGTSYTPNTEDAPDTNNILTGTSFKSQIEVRALEQTSLANMQLGAFSILSGTKLTLDSGRDANRVYYYTKSNTTSSGQIQYYSQYNQGEGDVISGTIGDGNNTFNTNMKANGLDPLYDVGTVVNNKYSELTTIEYALRINGKATVQNNLTVVYEDNKIAVDDNNNTIVTGKSIADCVSVDIAYASATNPAKIFVVAISGNNNTRYIGLYNKDTIDNIVENVTFGLNETETDVETENLTTQALQILELSARNSTETDEDGDSVNIRRAYACTFEVATNGKYYLLSPDDGISIAYLAVEGVPVGQVSSGVLTDSAVSAVDFIYDGVSITQSDITGDTTIESFNFVYNGGFYTSTGGRVTISTATTSAAVVLYFDKRVNNFILNVSWYGTRPTSSNTTTTYIDIADSPSENFAISDNTT